MLTNPWGAQFTLSYYPHVNGLPVEPPAQTPSIYVFDGVPSASDIDNGTNAIGIQITTWGEGTPNVRTIVIPKIDDPADSTKEKIYYIGLKYKLHTSGTSTYDILTFKLTRPDGQSADPTPTAAELKNIEKTLATYYPTDSDITNQIANAERHLKIWFRAQSVIWQQIENPEDLKDAIIYGALEDLFLDKRKAEGDTFDLKVRKYGKLAEDLRMQIKLEYDADDNADISESEENQPTGVISFIR